VNSVGSRGENLSCLKMCCFFILGTFTFLLHFCLALLRLMKSHSCLLIRVPNKDIILVCFVLFLHEIIPGFSSHLFKVMASCNKISFRDFYFITQRTFFSLSVIVIFFVELDMESCVLTPYTQSQGELVLERLRYSFVEVFA